ncbi:hypothetical protein QVD17_39211 [Tagetes erecta]|uniref:Uncharacterized protein n=1 Tax=Tagetes erecta TaxID=13708 RepID=A0AAD8JRX8_TARER|nr:hypothetical protein QVD17_39211 [Tagetes erecta]
MVDGVGGLFPLGCGGCDGGTRGLKPLMFESISYRVPFVVGVGGSYSICYHWWMVAEWCSRLVMKTCEVDGHDDRVWISPWHVIHYSHGLQSATVSWFEGPCMVIIKHPMLKVLIS